MKKNNFLRIGAFALLLITNVGVFSQYLSQTDTEYEGDIYHTGGKFSVGTDVSDHKVNIYDVSNDCFTLLRRVSSSVHGGYSWSTGAPGTAYSSSNPMWAMGSQGGDATNGCSFYMWNGSATYNYLKIATNGNIGMGGITAPTQKLDVAGNINLTGNLMKNGSQIKGIWAESGNNINYTLGSVGVGTTTPSEKFEVNGTGAAIKLVDGTMNLKIAQALPGYGSGMQINSSAELNFNYMTNVKTRFHGNIHLAASSNCGLILSENYDYSYAKYKGFRIYYSSDGLSEQEMVSLGYYGPTSFTNDNASGLGGIKLNNISQNSSATTGIQMYNGSINMGSIYTKRSNNEFVFQNNQTVSRAGFTFLNGTNEVFRIHNDGKAYARELIVQSSAFPDYVFKKDYKLYSLDELKEYIEKNNHLPNVPSEADVKANGNNINLGEMNNLLLEKVEELTLYVLQQQEEIKKLKETVYNK